jgi:hypothetical protein
LNERDSGDVTSRTCTVGSGDHLLQQVDVGIEEALHAVRREAIGRVHQTEIAVLTTACCRQCDVEPRVPRTGWGDAFDEEFGDRAGHGFVVQELEDGLEQRVLSGSPACAKIIDEDVERHLLMIERVEHGVSPWSAAWWATRCMTSAEIS